jgi:ketosteroid isomerase-like protein
LQAFEEKALDGLLASTQNAVLNVSLRDYSPPVLGNALRNAATKTRERFMADTAAALEGFRERFYGIVVLSDREIVAARWRPETDSKTGSAPASSHDTDTER